MTQEQIKSNLIDLCNEVFKESNIALDSIDCVDFINDLGMDSIMFITLVVEIETRFDITIPDHLLSMEHFNTIDAAVDIVSKLSLNN